MRTSLIAVAVAAYLHAHPDVFLHAQTLSTLLWIVVLGWLVLAIIAVCSSASS